MADLDFRWSSPERYGFRSGSGLTVTNVLCHFQASTWTVRNHGMNLALLRVRCFRKTSAELSSTLKLFEGNLEHQYSLRAEGVFLQTCEWCLARSWLSPRSSPRRALREGLTKGRRRTRRTKCWTRIGELSSSPFFCAEMRCLPANSVLQMCAASGVLARFKAYKIDGFSGRRTTALAAGRFTSGAFHFGVS
jgi:hypothetical protein